jgi:trimethylamine--corrinoid protein Co-methyltransferase
VSAEITAHPVQAVLDDDVAGMIGRFIEGVEVSDETLAIDLISDVGPIPGIFLNREHTRKWWKKEQYMTKAADRQSYDEWKRYGKKNGLDYAKEIMEEIIATHQPDPLTESQENDIEKILEDARQYYKKKGMM